MYSNEQDEIINFQLPKQQFPKEVWTSFAIQAQLPKHNENNLTAVKFTTIQ